MCRSNGDQKPANHRWRQPINVNVVHDEEYSNEQQPFDWIDEEEVYFTLDIGKKATRKLYARLSV